MRSRRRPLLRASSSTVRMSLVAVPRPRLSGCTKESREHGDVRLGISLQPQRDVDVGLGRVVHRDVADDGAAVLRHPGLIVCSQLIKRVLDAADRVPAVVVDGFRYFDACCEVFVSSESYAGHPRETTVEVLFNAAIMTTSLVIRRLTFIQMRESHCALFNAISSVMLFALAGSPLNGQ